jgi:hypothetical protein
MTDRGLRTGLSLRDWGDSFDLDSEQQELVGRYAERLLNDDLFQRVLAGMEHSVVMRWSQTKPDEVEKLTECRLQLEAVRWIRQTLKALSASQKIAQTKNID